MGKIYTEAQARATKKYLADFVECKARVPREQKMRFAKAAEAAGMSLNAYIVQAVEERIKRDQESGK